MTSAPVSPIPIDVYSSDFMSLKEYCQRTGTSYSQGVQRARTNTLLVPVIRQGRRFLIPRKAYERLLETQQGVPDHPEATNEAA